jgi:hypothetical protein
MILVLFFFLLIQVQSTTPNVNTCRLSPVGDSWIGSCGRLGNQNPTATLAPAKKITSGRWHKDSEPSAVWAGKITYSDDVDPIELEIYPDGKGILRTADGWFPIARSFISGNALEFDVDFVNEVPPSGLDREIIQHAASILSSEAVWNRTDTRECHPTDTKWSIYCAMEKATIDVTGGFHHRRPALQLVRKIVEERSVNRSYKHRLMDYNNDPATTFADVQSLFAEALHRMEQ